MQGRFAEGLPHYEWRVRRREQPRVRRDDAWARWDGAPLGERTLLLHFDEGLGDTLMCVRYIGALWGREPGARVILECQRELKTLLTRSLPRCRVVARGEALPLFDVHCPLMSLPLAFGTTPATIPGRVPYLTVNAEKSRRWRQRLRDGTQARRVGLVWAGSAAHPRDRVRSVGLAAFAPLARVRGVSFQSLQKGEAARQAAAPPGFRLTDLGGELADLDDTAALVANLGLVITVDTSVAHLAGALGRPVWVLLPFVTDWRWLRERDDTPWYPTMRLFRQRAPGDWGEVMARVAAALEVWAA